MQLHLIPSLCLALSLTTSFAQLLPNPSWTLRNPRPDWTLWHDFSVTDSAIYFTGQGGFSISTNGTDWTHHPTQPNLTIYNITKAQDRYLAVASTGGNAGTGNILLESSDGINFNYFTNAPKNAQELVFNNGQFFLRDALGNLSISTDLSTWTNLPSLKWQPLDDSRYSDLLVANGTHVIARSLRRYYFGDDPSIAHLTADKVAYHDGLFVGAYKDHVLYSTNGRNWETVYINTPDVITGLALGHNGVILVGHDSGKTNAIAMFSQDRRTWFSFVNIPPDARLATYFNGHYHIASERGILTSSSNGYSWSDPQNLDSPRLPNLNAAAFGWGHMVAMGNGARGANGYYSTNGIDWFPVLGYLPLNSRINDMIFAGNKLLGVADRGQIAISYGGKYWTTITVFPEPDLLSVTHSPLGFVAAGRKAVMHSENGLDWQAVAYFQQTCYSIAYGNGVFVATGDGRGAQAKWSTNLTYWTSLTNITGTRVAFGNGRFVMFGHSDVHLSTNGIDWTSTGVQVRQDKLEFVEGYFIASSGAESILSFDGVSWFTVPPAPVNGYLTRMDGRFFTLGAFGSILEANPFASLDLSRSGDQITLHTLQSGTPETRIETSSDLQTWTELPAFQSTAVRPTEDPSPTRFFRLRPH